MVERSHRDTVRRNRRNHNRECSASDCSGRGFYRSLSRRVATFGGASGRHLAALCAVSVLASLTGLSFAQAKDAYEAGDKNLALVYGKAAAEKGDTEAQVLVGHILMRGETGVIDYVAAADWFKKAALKDHPRCARAQRCDARARRCLR